MKPSSVQLDQFVHESEVGDTENQTRYGEETIRILGSAFSAFDNVFSHARKATPSKTKPTAVTIQKKFSLKGYGLSRPTHTTLPTPTRVKPALTRPLARPDLPSPMVERLARRATPLAWHRGPRSPSIGQFSLASVSAIRLPR